MSPRPFDVVLATSRDLPEPDADEIPTLEALARHGLRARSLAWDDPEADFGSARLTVLRATWTYPERPAAFAAWAERTAAVSMLLNPLPVVRWNLHKGYLLDLAARGIPVTPTRLLPADGRASFADVVHETGWADVVLKPAVSCGSRLTFRVRADEGPAGDEALARIRAEGDALVQPYLPSVDDHGERAVVCIDGAVTHAVRKSPRFSGQDECTSDALPVSAAEAGLARRCLAAVGTDLLYARVDMAPGPDGAPVLMELELIEPSLFFPACPPALERFATAVRRRVSGQGLAGVP